MKNPLRDAMARAAREASIYCTTQAVRLPVRDLRPQGCGLEDTEHEAEKIKRLKGRK